MSVEEENDEDDGQDASNESAEELRIVLIDDVNKPFRCEDYGQDKPVDVRMFHDGYGSVGTSSESKVPPSRRISMSTPTSRDMRLM